VPKRGPKPVLRQPTPTNKPTKMGPEIVDFRPHVGFLPALANRRLQPLGHLTVSKLLRILRVPRLRLSCPRPTVPKIVPRRPATPPEVVARHHYTGRRHERMSAIATSRLSRLVGRCLIFDPWSGVEVTPSTRSGSGDIPGRLCGGRERCRHGLDCPTPHARGPSFTICGRASPRCARGLVCL
jgi:hypothetical protein